LTPPIFPLKVLREKKKRVRHGGRKNGTEGQPTISPERAGKGYDEKKFDI